MDYYYYLDDKEFGRVVVTVRRDARRLSARWREGHVHLRVPVGVSVQFLRHFLEQARPKLRDMEHGDVAFAVGQVIPCFGFSITLGEQDRMPGYFTFSRDGNDLKLNVPRGLDLSGDSAKKGISRAIGRLLGDQAAHILLPYAAQVSRRLGTKPAGFEVGRGLRTLGHCTTQGVIQLSRYVELLPQPLVDLIVCHELAHLTHFNHSAAFHALVNGYLGGREKELTAQLKAFKWPILR